MMRSATHGWRSMMRSSVVSPTSNRLPRARLRAHPCVHVGRDPHPPGRVGDADPSGWYTHVLTSIGLCPRREPPRRGRTCVHPPRRVAVPRAHHGSGSGRVMEKASDQGEKQRKAHGIRFGASPSRHRGGRAWFLRERRGGRALGLGSRGTTDWKKNPTRQAPTAMFVATMAAHVWTPDHPAVLAASAPGRTLRHRMVGTPGAPVSAHSLTVLHVRADNMRIAGAAGSPGSRQIRYSSSPAHGLRLLRRSGYVSVVGGARWTRRPFRRAGRSCRASTREMRQRGSQA